jgi:iron complex transport system substrate-binding protein
MLLSTSAIAFCVGRLLNHGAVAAQLPQRWVSAGGALSARLYPGETAKAKTAP